MSTQERNIVESAILDLLTEAEQKALKLLLENDSNYQNFLTKLFEVIIGKEKTLSLTNLLEFHNLSHKSEAFQNSTTSIIEDVAELADKGHSSEYTEWLKDNKNQIYLDHITFIKEIKRGFAIKERVDLKDRLLLLDKMKGFDVTDDEIRAGLTILERRRLKKRFAELDAQYEERLKLKSRSPYRLKLASIVLLISASGAILAFSIPQVRNFIKKEIKELFQKEEPVKPLPNKLNKNTDMILMTDTVISQIDSTGLDSVFIKSESLNHKEPQNIKPKIDYKKNAIKEVIVVPKKEVPLIAHIVNNEASISDYQKYFRRNKNQLESIESIWKINGVIRKYPDNPVILTCAIRKLEGNLYELVYFTIDGNIANMHYKSVITSKGDFSNFQLSQYENDTLCSQNGIFLSEKNILTFKSHFIFGDFANVTPEMESEKVECIITAKKKR